MHQQVPSPDAYRHREHNVLELLRRDRARVWDWDVDVSDFRSSVNGLFPAERNDGRDALRPFRLAFDPLNRLIRIIPG